MDSRLVYAKTPTGDEAVRQSTRVVQRNLRMVLVQVDGKLSVAELSAKIGSAEMVEGALRELEEGGYIAPTIEAASIWEQSKLQAQEPVLDRISALSQFSTFGPRSKNPVSLAAESAASGFSTFDPPVGGRRANDVEPALVRDTIAEPSSAERSGRSKWLLRGAGGVLVALIVLGLFYPYGRHTPAIERSASALLGAEVHIGRVSLSWSPRPELLLEELRIGRDGGAVDRLAIASPWSLLFSGSRSLPAMRASGVRLTGDQISAFAQSASGTASGMHWPQRVEIERMTLQLGGLSSESLGGSIDFLPGRGIARMAFESAGGELKLTMLPGENGLLLDIEGTGWKPLGAGLAFSSLRAKGLLQAGRMLVRELDAGMLGGAVKGEWLLDWRNGMAMAGDFRVLRVDCRRLLRALAQVEGGLDCDLAGSLRLRSSGGDVTGLLSGIEATFDATLSRGVVQGIDLGEAARRGAGGVTLGGATKFEQLTTALAINATQVIARGIQLDAGMLTASGQVMVGEGRRLEGGLTVLLKTSVSSIRTPVRLAGTFTAPEVRGSK